MTYKLRLIITVALSIAILFVYDHYFKVTPPPPTPQTTVPQTKTATTDPSSPTPTLSSSVPHKFNSHETRAQVKNVEIQTPLSKIILSTQGGVLTSYELKEYHQTANKESPFKNLLTETPGSTALFLGIKGYTAFDNTRVFELLKDEMDPSGARRIVLEWENGEIRIRKIFTFSGLKTVYAVGVDYEITNLSSQPLQVAPLFENALVQKIVPPKQKGFLSFFQKQQTDLIESLYFKDKKLTTFTKWDGLTTPITDAQVSWAGLADRYFLWATLPSLDNTGIFETIFSRKDNTYVAQFVRSGSVLTAGQMIRGNFVGYIGPKKLETLSAVGSQLNKCVDFGWFSILSTPILWLMTFLHKFIPNWGLVIIALTFIVKMFLHPINKKSMASMKGMQQLQPKIQELKAKFPNDKQAQQHAMMQLFKTHKVNPMGGCLPMMLQMPIYIILYKVLWNSIELYHAPFFWIYKDLSAPDPFLIMPILLGVFMFLQQKLTPTASVDPAQQKMVMIMPIMFTGFMLFLPVGLVIYIWVNTVMSVIQQYMMKKDISFRDILMGKFKKKAVVVSR